ncbi:MAG TPA: carboxypeptidase-like regulatory domain-containing protein, partial [Terriglobales bacterium]|nr:carboxypeptidase-like regulatory domain-containing protein [Terriglobales bacterium]
MAVAWVALVFAAAVPGYAQNAAKAPVAQKQLVGQILGTVRSGNMAVPGATISAVDSDSGKRVLTSSNVDGSYVLHLPPGDYNVQVQMTAFAAANREAVINSSVLQVQLDFDLILQSRINQKRTLGRLAGQGGVASPGMGGMQAMLAANGDEGGNGPGDQVVPQGMPVPGLAPNGATESVAVSGNTVNNQFSGLSTADMEQRVREWREQRANSNGLNPNAVGPGGQEGPGGGARPGAAAAAGPRGNGVGPMMVFGGRGRF